MPTPALFDNDPWAYDKDVVRRQSSTQKYDLRLLNGSFAQELPDASAAEGTGACGEKAEYPFLLLLS